MKPIRLGERQGFANEASQPLPQGIEPTLNMVGLAAIFTRRLMAVSGKDALISLPEIAERAAARLSAQNASPEGQAIGLGAVAN